MVLVAPTLLVLIIQIAIFPITLQSYTQTSTVNFIICIVYFLSNKLYTVPTNSKMILLYHLCVQDNLGQEKVFFTCEGKYYLIFDRALFTGDIILASLSLVLAYKTKKHLPADKKYRKYHESAVINLTATVGIFLSSISKAIILLFQMNHIHNGILLLVTLRECLWLYPVSFLLFTPKVRCTSYFSCLQFKFLVAM